MCVLIKYETRGDVQCTYLKGHVSDTGQSLVGHLLHSCHGQTIPVTPHLMGLQKLSLENWYATTEGALLLQILRDLWTQIAAPIQRLENTLYYIAYSHVVHLHYRSFYV